MSDSESSDCSTTESGPIAKLPTTSRRTLLDRLASLQFNADPKHINLLTGKCKNKEHIIHEINKASKVYQKRADLEIKTEEFTHINQWTNYFHNITPSNTNSQIAVALRYIAMNEAFPSPEQLDGVNMKQLYAMLAEAFDGKPFEAVSGPTLDYLKEVFDKLMHEGRMDKVSTNSEVIKAHVEELCLADPDDKLCGLRF